MNKDKSVTTNVSPKPVGFLKVGSEEPNEITKEEAIEHLKTLIHHTYVLKTRKIITMAIEALEQKPSGEGVKSADEYEKEILKLNAIIEDRENHCKFLEEKRTELQENSDMLLKFQPPVKIEGVKSVEEVLLTFLKLEDNWNTYGAKKPSVALIESANKIINLLSLEPLISLTGRDSIQIEYEDVEKGYLEIEVYENKVELFCEWLHQQFHPPVISDEEIVQMVKEELLKHLVLVVYENGYPIKAVPQATILELPILMRKLLTNR